MGKWETINTRSAGILLLLATICCVEFLLHIGINGELLAWQAYTLHHPNASNGVGMAVNEHVVHLEAISNIRNIQFFVGDNSFLDLAYNVTTGRLLAPFFTSLVYPFTGDIITSRYLLNLISWILAAWCAYGIGKLAFKDEVIAICLGVLVATSQGYISKSFGMKTHLLAFSFFTFLIFLAEWLRVFERDTRWKNHLAMGVVASLGIFINATHVMFLVYYILRTAFRIRFTIIAIPLIVVGSITALLSGLYDLAALYGIPVWKMEAQIVSNGVIHLRAILEFLLSGTTNGFSFDSGNGYGTHFNNILGPYIPVLQFLPMFLLLPGVPIVVLASIGILTLNFQRLFISIAIIFSCFLFIAMVHVYWDIGFYQAYNFYYTIIGFYILASFGVVRLATAAQLLGQLAGITYGQQRVLFKATIVSLLLVVVVYTNQDILFGYYIEHLRFHRLHSVPFPHNWPFKILDW